MSVSPFKLTLLVLVFIILGFLFGWIFPVEGPIDYMYDEYASQPAHRHPPTAPLKSTQFIIDINDLSEEDFEALQSIFLNK